MPLSDPENEVAYFPYPATPETPVPTPGPETSEVIWNTLKLENPVAGYLSRPAEQSFQKVEGYTPFTPGNLTGYEAHAERFVDVISPEHETYVKKRIDEERQMQETVAAGGNWQQFASLAVTLGADPLNYIGLGPMFALSRKAAEVAKFAKPLAAAAPTAAGFAAITAANEIALQQQQETRSLDTSTRNIIAAGVAGGAFGGGLALYTARQQKILRTAPLRDAQDVAAEMATGEKGSVGAKAAGFTFEEQQLKSAFGLEKAFKFNDPILRTLNSEATSVRNLSEQIGETYLTRKKNVQGIASVPSIENEIKSYDANKMEFIRAVKDEYINYKQAVAKEGGKGLSLDEFYQEIGKAAARNDSHEIAQVSKSASYLRQFIFDPLFNKAVELGIISADAGIKTAPSYVTRLYDKAKILADIPEFTDINLKWLQRERDAANGRLAQWEGLIKTTSDEYEKVKNELSAAKEEAAFKTEQTRMAKAIGYQKGIRQYKDYVIEASKKTTAQEQKFDPAKYTKEIEQQYIDNLHKDLIDFYKNKNNKVTKKPAETLSAYVTNLGGVFDNIGDLKTSQYIRVGLLRTEENAVTLDQMAETVTKAGFFSKTPTAEQLSAALIADLSGNTIVRLKDVSKVVRSRHIENIATTLERDGFKDLSTFSSKNLKDYLENIFQDAPYFRDKSVGVKAAYAEVAYGRSLWNEIGLNLEDAIKAADKEAITATDDLMKARLHNLPIIKQTIKGLEESKEKLFKNLDALEKSRERDLFFGNRDDGELNYRALEITNRILSTPDTRLPYDFQMTGTQNFAAKVGFGGPMRPRVYDIPDDLVEPFLIRDAGAIAHAYTRALASDVTIMERFGTLVEDEILAPVNSEYIGKIFAAGNDAKAAAKIKKSRDRDLRDLRAMLQKLRGTYGEATDDFARGLRSAERIAAGTNVITHLGGQTLAAFMDIVRPVMVHGLTNTLRFGLKPLITNLRGFRMAALEIQEAGTAGDMVLNSRMNALSGVDDFTPALTRAEAVIDRETNRFAKLSLMNHWNSGMKQFSGVITQSRFLEAAKKWTEGKISQNDIERLASSFVDNQMARRITQQFEKYGTKQSGVNIPNTKLWDDMEAQKIFRAAIRREVDNIIVTPGLAKPLWMSRAGLRLIGQFKSYAMASMQSVFLAGLQQRDAAVLNGVILMVSFGMLTYAARGQLAGKELSDDPAVWLREGIDRSGITGWLFDANNIVEKMSRNTYGLAAVMGADPSSRYASRSAAEALFGPTYGTMMNMLNIAGSAAVGDWRAGDTSDLRRMIPYQNLFYIRSIFDEMERGLNDALGVPQKEK